MALDIQRWTTASGAQVLFVPSESPNVVDVELSFLAGSVYETKGKAGLASLTVDLLSAGAKNLPEESILQRLADTAAQWSFAVDKDRATVNLRVLSTPEVRDAAADLLSRVLQEPTFPSAAFRRERDRSIANLQDAETQPEYLSEKELWSLMYGNHPYGAAPSVEQWKNLSRQDVVNFYKTHFTAAGASIAVVGNISRADVEALVAKLTKGLSSVKAPVWPAAQVVAPLKQTSHIPHPASQAHIAVGTPVLTRDDPDYFPLLVGNYVLGGGGFVSRLMKIIREKEGLAYSVYSYFYPLRQAGPLQIGLQTKKENTDLALNLVNKTLTDFIQEGPTVDELNAAKDNQAGGFALRTDSNRKLLGYLGVMGFYGLPVDWLERYPKAVREVTREQIVDAYRRRIDLDHLVTVVVAGSSKQTQ